MAREFIHDHLKQLWCGVETTFGAAALPAATDALDIVSIDAGPVSRRVIPNVELTGNRGAKAPGRGAVDPMAITVEAYLKGSGSATTAPDFAPLLRASGFTETVGGASVSYARTDEPTDTAWIWLTHQDGSEGRMYGGCVFSPSVPDVGVDFARIRFQGNASHASVVYRTVVGTGGITAIATSLPLNSNHGWVIGGVGAYISVTDGVDTEVMQVTAVSGNSATVVRAQASTTAVAFSAGDAITAYVPSRTVTSVAPIGETLGSFTLDDGGGTGQGRDVVKATLEIASGIDHLEKEAFSSNREGIAAMRYGENGARLTADFIYSVGSDGVAFLHAQRDAGTETEVVLVVGTAAGNTFTFTMPTAQVVDLSAPDGADGPRKGTVIFGAYSDDGADISITCT